MFSSIQVAVDSAKIGDTVFVHASTVNYTNTIVKKRIVLLGEGGKPNYSNLFAYIPSLSIDTLGGLQVSGLIVNGLKIGAFSIEPRIKGIIIRNCHVSSTSNLYGVGHTIINNIFSYFYVYLGTNSVFSNNIITFSISSGENCVISNNIFIAGQLTSGSVRDINGCTVVNNIFISTDKAFGVGLGNSFNKNLQAGTDLPSDNLKSAFPINVFTESTITSSMTEEQYLTASWKQLSTSVGINAGTDGKDVGVYGGNFPWPSNKIFNGDPGLPKVELLEVQNAVVEPNGTIKFNFKAKSASAK